MPKVSKKGVPREEVLRDASDGSVLQDDGTVNNVIIRGACGRPFAVFTRY